MTNPELFLKMESQVTSLFYKNKCLFCLLLVITRYSFQSSKERETGIGFYPSQIQLL